jgi:hypothetical protein
VYAKEQRLIELVKDELRTGRRCCHIYAVYTQKRDVTRRLESILAREGIRVAVLTSNVPVVRQYSVRPTILPFWMIARGS